MSRQNQGYDYSYPINTPNFWDPIPMDMAGGAQYSLDEDEYVPQDNQLMLAIAQEHDQNRGSYEGANGYGQNVGHSMQSQQLMGQNSSGTLPPIHTVRSHRSSSDSHPLMSPSHHSLLNSNSMVIQRPSPISPHSTASSSSFHEYYEDSSLPDNFLEDTPMNSSLGSAQNRRHSSASSSTSKGGRVTKHRVQQLPSMIGNHGKRGRPPLPPSNDEEQEKKNKYARNYGQRQREYTTKLEELVTEMFQMGYLKPGQNRRVDELVDWVRQNKPKQKTKLQI